jgi:hypothetical protein
MTRFAGPVALLGLAAALVLPPVRLASAGEVATTARSQSLLIPGEFLDAPDILHRFPHLATAVSSRLFASSPEFETLSGGTVASSGSAAGFLLGQPFNGISVRTGGYLVQAGGALAWRGLRVGAALRASTDRVEQSYRQDYADPQQTDRVQMDETTEQQLEGALGFGVGGNERFVDLVWEPYREDFEALYSDIDYYSGGVETLLVSVDALARFRHAVAVRGGFGAGDLRIRLAGDFQDRTARADVVERAPPEATIRPREKRYGHSWTAGVAVSGVFESGTLATVHVRYRDVRGPVVQAYYRIEQQTLRTEEVLLGVSLERPIWYELRLLAGMRSAFTVRNEGRRAYERDGTIYGSSLVDETVSQQFAWGLTRSFERLELTGSMRTDVALSDLFLTLDVVLLP